MDGSIFGKNFKAIGNKNSIKGTIIKIAKGTKRKISIVVRISCILEEMKKMKNENNKIKKMKNENEKWKLKNEKWKVKNGV